MKVIREELGRIVKQLFGCQVGDYELTFKPTYGDLSTNLAFKLASQTKLAPREIAQKIQENFRSDKIKEISVAGVGFLNFKLTDEQVLEFLSQEDFKVKGQGQKSQVEFISANPTGPLTLGNGRGGFYGDAIAKLLAWAGDKVEREYYVNDLGVQIEKLGESILHPDQGVYQGEYIDEIKKAIKKNGSSLATGQQAAEIILEKYIQPTVAQLKIKFDVWQKESQLYQKHSIEDLVSRLKAQNLIKEKAGSVWFLSSRLGDDKDRVLKRKTGKYTYIASDGLYLLDKYERGFEKLIYLWGADHAGYVRRFLGLAKALGWRQDQIKIIITQLVRLKKRGEYHRMSKRSGNVIDLADLADKVGLDSVRFFFLQRAPSSHLDFDWQLAQKRDPTNPVFYIQYGLVRAKSILSKLKANSSAGGQPPKRLKGGLSAPQKLLANQILAVEPALQKIYQTLEIHQLAQLALDLARSWHNFYEKERILNSSGQAGAVGLLLVRKTKQALELLLDLMGISQPNKM